MQKKIIKQDKRNVVSRMLHAKEDKDKIATWKQDLNRFLHIFNVRSDDPVWLSLRNCSSDGVADGYPRDRFGYSSERHVGRPGRLQRSKCISEYGPIFTNNGTLIVSQTQARSAVVNFNGP